ncbi:hypothetical protein C0J52_15762 [Blattella germanica]|nr:hypothetical protein C0J52_15762 [Blattella germanica]
MKNRIFKEVDGIFGHSCLPNDKDFGNIKKLIKCYDGVYVPEEYAVMIKKASQSEEECSDDNYIFGESSDSDSDDIVTESVTVPSQSTPKRSRIDACATLFQWTDNEYTPQIHEFDDTNAAQLSPGFNLKKLILGQTITGIFFNTLRQNTTHALNNESCKRILASNIEMQTILSDLLSGNLLKNNTGRNMLRALKKHNKTMLLTMLTTAPVYSTLTQHELYSRTRVIFNDCGGGKVAAPEIPAAESGAIFTEGAMVCVKFFGGIMDEGVGFDADDALCMIFIFAVLSMVFFRAI